MRVVIAWLLLAVLMSGTSGCGVMFNGTRQTITATSAPDAAQLSTNPGGFNFTTPASIALERKNDYVLTFTKEGYSPATFQIQKKLQGGIVVLDVLFTGLIGVVIDATTGGWYKLSPETAIVSLTKLSAGCTAGAPGCMEGPDRIEVTVTGTKSGEVTAQATESGVLMKAEKRP